MLAETRLSERVRLATVVSVVDPGTFGDLLETLPNIAAQVEAADIVLVNKADLYDEDALRATEADVRRINVRAKIVRTQRCEAALDVFVPAVRGVLQGEYALCSDPNYARTRVTPADNLDLRQLATRLRPLAQRAYRLKGFVRHDGRLHLLDVSRAGITITPTTARDATPGLVCIYPPDSRDELRPLLAELESGVLASESA
jgi:G3E family GTPase